MITPRWVETRTQPIAISDVVRYLIAALEDTSDADALYEAKGAGKNTAMCPLGQAGVRAEAVGSVVELTSDDAASAAQLFVLAQTHAD